MVSFVDEGVDNYWPLRPFSSYVNNAVPPVSYCSTNGQNSKSIHYDNTMVKKMQLSILVICWSVLCSIVMSMSHTYEYK